MLDKIDKLVFGAGALNPKASTPEGLDLLRTIRPEMLPEAFAIAYKNKSPNPELWEDFVMASKKMWLDEVWIPSEILPHINSEVLILSGDRDPFIPLHHTIAIYNQLANGELCVVPKLQHDLFNHPESVNSVLIRFLSDD